MPQACPRTLEHRVLTQDLGSFMLSSASFLKVFPNKTRGQ